MDSKNCGRKDDQDKPRMDLLPPNACLEVGQVLRHGAEVYGDENWRMVENLEKRYLGAALRHIFAHMAGESNDRGSGYTHLAHAICSLMFVVESSFSDT